LMSDHEYFGWALFAMILFPAIYFAPVVKREPKAITHSLTKPKFAAAIPLLCLGPVLNILWAATPTITDISNKIPHALTPVPKSKMPIKVELPNDDKAENAVTPNEV